MSSPACKRQKLADDVKSVAKMSNVLPMKDSETQTDNPTITASASNERSIIDINAQRFVDVASSDGFVDRTMLIEELLQQKPNYVMMFAPSKFGKTINLDMIRFFLDIEDKDTKTKEDVTKEPTMQELRSNPSKNMKVLLRQFENVQYEECLILKREKFVIQHFGRHPVVWLNFKNFTAKDESGAIFYCAKQVRNGYLENDYLKHSEEFPSGSPRLCFLKQQCENWFSYGDAELKSLSVGEVIDGLENLIKSLRVHWGRKPVFLVDEIDKPSVVAMDGNLSERQVGAIGTTITKVVCSILKSEDEQLILQAALVTGICKFQNAERSLSRMDNTVPVYFLSDERFSKYYGLTVDEVDSLVRRFFGQKGDAEIKKIISDINSKYNGYYQRSFSGEIKEYSRYCLFSVLNYIRDINKDKDKFSLRFWPDGDLTSQLMPILKKSDIIMSGVHTLLYGDAGTIAIKYQPMVDVEHLLGQYRGEMVPNPDTIFNFFLQQGYLAHSPEEPEENVAGAVKIHVKIPNLEIKDIYHQIFLNYYDQLPEDIKSKFTSCGQIFKSLPTLNSNKFRDRLSILGDDLKCIFRYMQCKSEASICCYLLVILKHYAGYDKGEMKYAVQYFDNNKPSRVYIDIWGRHGNFDVILEIKYNPGHSFGCGHVRHYAKSSLAAAEDIIEHIIKVSSFKLEAEDIFSSKAGTGRALEVLKSSKSEHYVLVGLAVDDDYTTHMLVFRDTTNWKNVIMVNAEDRVGDIIREWDKKSVA